MKRKQVLKAMQHIINGFEWRDTPQGPMYWDEVYFRLRLYANDYRIKRKEIGKTEKRATKAALAIFDMAPWFETVEGSEYWCNVFTNLVNIAKVARDGD